MKPGRELDALVAKKVMGWDGFSGIIETSPEVGFSTEEIDELVKTGKLRFRPPEYSTDIAAAWQVVEKMQRENHDFAIHITSCRDEDNQWQPHFNISVTRTLLTGSKTAPHAICLAALKAVGAL